MSEIDYHQLILSVESPACAVKFAAIKKLGSLEAAAFLQQAAFFSAGMKKTGGWFYLSQVGEANPSAENSLLRAGSWEALLCIKKDGQAKIRKQLISIGLLKEARRGVPGRLHFHVDPKKYIQWLSTLEPVRSSSDSEKSETSRRKTGNKSAKNRKLVAEKSVSIQDTKQETEQENTTTSNHAISPTTPQSTAGSSIFDIKQNPKAVQGTGIELDIPENLSCLASEILSELTGLESGVQQQIVYELSVQMNVGKVKSPIAWLQALVQKAKNGTFNFSAGRALEQKPKGVGYRDIIKHEQTVKAAEDAALKALKQSNREVSDYIKSLPPAERATVEEAFAKHLEANNKMIAQFFRRSGFQNPSVVTEFKAFQKLGCATI